MSLREWYRETVRDPRCFYLYGSLTCSYCGETLCFPVPGLDLDRVASAHYARAWRAHGAITKARAAL
jgi:hypothetical protein